MRIFLTGFMGSGKSFVGNRLAVRLGIPFVDLDTIIEEKAGTSISELFQEQGEAEFRRLEASLLRSFDNLPLFIMATGGGTPCFNDNMAWMNRIGETVFIDPEPEIIAGRLRKERDKRPLLQGTDDILSIVYRMVAERREYYEAATHHITQVNPDTDIVGLIESRIKNERINSNA